jgi:hypothetical protein
MILSKETIVEVISKSLPYPDQITHWDFSDKNAVTFWWRGNHLSVSHALDVNQVDGNMHTGTDLAIVIRTLLKSRWITIEEDRKE